MYQSLLRKRYVIDAWQGSEYFPGSKYTGVLNMPGLHKIFKEMVHDRCLTGFRIYAVV